MIRFIGQRKATRIAFVLAAWPLSVLIDRIRQQEPESLRQLLQWAWYGDHR